MQFSTNSSHIISNSSHILFSTFFSKTSTFYDSPIIMDQVSNPQGITVNIIVLYIQFLYFSTADEKTECILLIQ
jgi:hypothetical protein